MSLANSGPLSQFALIKEFIDIPKFKNVKKVYGFILKKTILHDLI